MSYATKADMVLRFGAQELIQITDRERIGDIDDSVLDRAIADAEAEINASLQDRYALPLTTVPPLVTRIACQLIRYFLYDNGAPENVSVSATEARAVLKGIAAGTLRLGLDAFEYRTCLGGRHAHVFGRAVVIQKIPNELTRDARH